MILDALKEALSDLPIADDPRATGLMAAHWELVVAWNERVNLTSIDDELEAAWVHYRDSLEALELLVPGDIVDLGSGAGYPGIPLAIAEPSRRVTLVEPRRKRASFLETAASRLGLSNVTVLETRSETSPRELAANVVTRATFSAVNDLLVCRKWVASGGQLLAYRSEPSGDPGAKLHRYALNGESRVIEIWQGVPA